MISGSPEFRTYITALVVRFFVLFHAPSWSRISLPFSGVSFRKFVFQIAIKRALDDHVVGNVQPVLKDHQQAGRVLIVDRVLELIVRLADRLPNTPRIVQFVPRRSS